MLAAEKTKLEALKVQGLPKLQESPNPIAQLKRACLKIKIVKKKKPHQGLIFVEY